MQAAAPAVAAHRRPDGTLAPLRGELPETCRATAETILSDRVAARKTPQGILAAVPAGAAGHVIWLHPRLAEGRTITDHLQALRGESAALLAAQPAGEEPVAKLLAAARQAAALPRKARETAFVSGLSAAGLLTITALVPIRGGKVRRARMSARADCGAADETRALVAACHAAGLRDLEGAGPDSAQGLDAELLAARLGISRLDLRLPAGDGMAVVVADPAPRIQPLLPLLPDMAALALAAHGKPRGPLRPKLALGLTLAGLAALLAMPAPVIVTATGIARPVDAHAVSLPADAILTRLVVAPGDAVRAGEDVAIFTSPLLEGTRDRHAIEAAYEETAAQDALAKGDVTEYQLAGQRAEIARTRLAQADAELARLVLRAPVSGRVTAVLPEPMPGRHLPRGTEIVQVQEGDGFGMVAELAEADARRVSPGQVAELRFRGISARAYPAEVTGPPSRVTRPETGTETMTVTLRLRDAATPELMAGLSGLARIETGTAPRVLGLTRALAEHAASRAWRWFGWRL